MNILYYYKLHVEKQMTLIFLDAEKAFVKVDGTFLLQQLKTIEVGEEFERMIQAIYSQQKAKIRINGDSINYVFIDKGTRQGCPHTTIIYIYARNNECYSKKQ